MALSHVTASIRVHFSVQSSLHTGFESSGRIGKFEIGFILPYSMECQEISRTIQ